MKIDSIDKFQKLPNPVSATPKPKGLDFGSVLEKTIDKSEAVPGGRTHSIRPAAVTMGNGMNAPSLVSVPGKAACELLDTLEGYQQLLADPGVSLRKIEPMVNRMQNQLADTESLFNALPEDHPVKGILHETMLHMSQEIGRFNSGSYVDRE